MTNPKPREAKSELRRWCPIAEVHQDEADDICNMEYCRPPVKYHHLRVRRMLVCSVCEQGYFKREAFDAHECSDAY